MDTQRNALDERELIAQVNRDFGTNHEDLLTALDEFYLNGCADEHSGNVEAPTGHFFRVHRWIVTTDNYGFKSLNECDTESDAINEFRAAEKEYAAWDAEED
jgi:hypothetical protein